MVVFRPIKCGIGYDSYLNLAHSSFLVSRAKYLSPLRIFLKNQLLVSLFSTVFYSSISFISGLVFIPFLLLTLVFISSSSSSSLRCTVKLLKTIFS